MPRTLIDAVTVLRSFEHRIARAVYESALGVEEISFNIIEHNAGEDLRRSPSALKALAAMYCEKEKS